MSFGSSTGQRHSWRSQPSRQSSRTARRVLFTAIAVVLVAWLIWLLTRPQPDRQVRTWLIQPGSYDTEIITPMMYGASAADAIKQQIGPETGDKVIVVEGDTETIQAALIKSDGLKKSLDTQDDTQVLIVRGYLMVDDEGHVCIAASDLGVRDLGARDQGARDQGARDLGASDLGARDQGTPSKPLGLVRLDDLLTPLSRESAAGRITGHRVVVLDIEPLGVEPRLAQVGDQAFAALDRSLANLDGPNADRVWLLVTRGPMENVGWNAAAKLPLSTQALLAAWSSLADLDTDGSLGLDEVCRVIDAQYRRMADRSISQPRVVLMRGRKGVVDASQLPTDVWLGYRERIPTPEMETPPEPGDDADADETDEEADDDKTDAGEINAGDDDAGTPGTGADDDATTVDAASANVSPVLDQPGDVWTELAAFEAMSLDRQLHPIAIAPHLFRKLVLRVTNAEIESLDPLAPQSRRSIADEVAKDLWAWRRELQASPGTAAVTRSVGDQSQEIVRRMWVVTQQVHLQRKPGQFDAGVAAADELQRAIAIARLRWWQLLRYREQALLADETPIVEPDSLVPALRDAESNPRTDTDAMSDQARQLRRLVDEMDRAIDDKIDERLRRLREFKGLDAGRAWPEIRRAHALLRSSLPDGDQRARLRRAIDDLPVARLDLATIPSDADAVTDVIGLADATASIEPLAKADEIIRTQRRFDEADAAADWAAAMRLDPRDVSLADAQPVNHGVAAAPRDRRPVVRLIDSGGNVVGQSDGTSTPGGIVTLASLKTQRLTLEIAPDADQPLLFEVSLDFPGVVPSAGSSPSVRVSWRDGVVGVTPGRDASSRRIEVPAGEVGRGILELSPRRYASESTPSIKLRLTITRVPFRSTPGLGGQPGLVGPAGQADAADPFVPEVAAFLKSLDQPWPVTLKLPRREVIRLIAKTDGLTQPVESNQGRLSDGLHLRTFASRPTKFVFGIRSDAPADRRVRAWLLRLPNTFANEDVLQYDADLFDTQTDRLRVDWLGAKGKVAEAKLSGPSRLIGPAEWTLPPGRSVPLTWAPPPTNDPDAPATGTPPPVDPATESSPAETDVSHGMVLVLREIDANGVPMDVTDELIWLFPKPWSPEDYVEVNNKDVRFRDGSVTVNVRRKTLIDGDDQSDSIPGINTQPLDIVWVDDDQIEGFRGGKPSRPSIRLTSNANDDGELKKTVRRGGRPETLVELEVDGWPRAIARMISHRNGSTGKSPLPRDRVAFASVEMRYDENAVVDPDQPTPEGRTIHDPPKTIAFRGRGIELRTRLRTDLSAAAVNAVQRVVEVRQGNRVTAKFKSDRAVTTTLTSLNVDGEMVLLTTVDDLEVGFDEANRANDRLRLSVTIAGSGDEPKASLDVLLDSMPPKVSGLAPSRREPFYVGQTLRWNIFCEDVASGDILSGIRRIVTGIDTDGDNRPDASIQEYRWNFAEPTPQEFPARIDTITPAEAGPLRFAVEVWDDVGQVSAAVSREINVRAAPK